MLEKLIHAYAEHLGIDRNYASEIEEADGVYAFLIEGRFICTIEEKWFDEINGNCICLLCALSGEQNADDLIAAEELYLSRLRQTPLFMKGHLVFTDDYSLGFSYKIDAATVDENNFPHLLDVFVATVMALTTAGDEENSAAAEEIMDKFFQPCSDTGYRKFLQDCAIDEKDLRDHFGVLSCDEDFSTLMTYHELSGLVILEKSLACDHQEALICLLYLNGIDCKPLAYDYRQGSLQLISAFDPRTTTPEEFVRILLSHRFLFDKTREYLEEEAPKIEEFDGKEIMNMLLV